MKNLAKGFLVLSILAFLLAVVQALFKTTLLPQLLHVYAEGFSRASANLALIAIGITICFKKEEE